MKIYNKELHSGLFRPLGITGADTITMEAKKRQLCLFLFGLWLNRKLTDILVLFGYVITINKLNDYSGIW